MRTSAFTVAILAITTVTTTLSISAQDDFSALLADLSFGDAPSLHENLAVVEEEPAEDLKPLPSGFCMPGMLESTPPEASEVAAEIVPEVAPKVALQDPIPAVTPESSDQVDFDTLFSLQEASTPVAEVVGHIHNRCDVPHCNPVIVCTPHVAPNLPTSTLIQYFRSNKCHTHVWDGYQQHCHNNKHMRGDCDCFKNGGKHGCGLSTCNGGDCASCDSGCGQ